MSRIKIFGITGVSLFVFGVMFGFVIFPEILKFLVHKQVNLQEGSKLRSLWSKFPFALDFKLYLFNVTNADEVKNGSKPMLREVGPYYFEEWVEKVDLRDREDDDTVDYTVKSKYIFKPELCGELTGDEELVVPHIFMLVMMMATVREKPTMIPIVSKAIDSIFKNPDNVFVKVKAMDVIANGLPIDCTMEDFSALAVCSVIKENPTDLIIKSEDMYLYSLIGAKNNTPTKKRVRVLRGIKNQMDVGRVVEYDGKPNIGKWGDEYCDSFNGTDGTVFHPFFAEKEDIVSFAPDICRSLSITYEKESFYKGMHTSRYTAYLGDPDTIPWQKCYCPAPDNCLGKGMMDTHKCTGVPIVLSHPHFYLGDEKYLKMVDGLSPSKEKHEIWLEFDPLAGAPLIAVKRIQVNVMIHKINKFKIMKNFPEALLPLFWIDEGVALPDWFIDEVKSEHTMVAVANYIQWIMIIGGMILCCYTGWLYYQAKKKLVQITKVNK